MGGEASYRYKETFQDRSIAMTTYIILFTITTLFIALLFVYRKKSKETPSPTEKSSEVRHLEAQKKADAEKRRAEEERRAKEETERRVQAARRAKEQEREAARLKALEEKQKREAERRKRESAAKAEAEERARREEAARQKAQMAAREKEREERLKRAAEAAKEKAEKEAAAKREVAKKKSVQAAETPRESSEVSAPITLPDYPAFSHERLLEMGLSDEDAKAFVQELIEQIETEIPLIEAAMLQHDFHQMERVTHGIKGSSTNVGTGGVTDLIVAYNTYLKTGTDMAIAAIYHARLKKELERLKTQYCSTK
jgi:uncharacterized phage infection (PIP) family protein YhgE